MKVLVHTIHCMVDVMDYTVITLGTGGMAVTTTRIWDILMRRAIFIQFKVKKKCGAFAKQNAESLFSETLNWTALGSDLSLP